MVRCTRHLPLAALTVTLGLSLGRPLLAAWLDARELNANFFFAACGLLGAGQLLLAYDVAAAALHADAHAAAENAASVLQRTVRRQGRGRGGARLR